MFFLLAFSLIEIPLPYNIESKSSLETSSQGPFPVLSVGEAIAPTVCRGATTTAAPEEAIAPAVCKGGGGIYANVGALSQCT